MSLDFYGFPLHLSSAHQAAARQRCDAVEMKQDKAWAKYAKKNQAPVDDTRKKLCRKVLPPAQMGCLHVLLAPGLQDQQCFGMPENPQHATSASNGTTGSHIDSFREKFVLSSAISGEDRHSLTCIAS